MNGYYNTTEEAEGVDVYVLDTGIRGASRPTGTNVGLHPELFDITNNADLNGLSEQQSYRVYEHLVHQVLTPVSLWIVLQHLYYTGTTCLTLTMVLMMIVHYVMVLSVYMTSGI